MEIILWRHAEAEDGADDMARALTARGVRHAARVGRWLGTQVNGSWRILVSPALRARQTAAGLGMPFSIEPGIAPGAPASAVLQASGWPDGRSNVIIVGHQPTLGEVAALLMTGSRADVAIRKGAAWWFSVPAAGSRGAAREVRLKAVVGPEVARRLGSRA